MADIVEQPRESNHLPKIITLFLRGEGVVSKGGVKGSTRQMHDTNRVDVPRVHCSREGQLRKSHLENVSKSLDKGVIQYGQLLRRNSNGSVNGIAYFSGHGSDVA